MKILLVDYKGKYTIAMDEDCVDELDYVVGETTKEELKAEVKERRESSLYYGIPAYVGNDPDLLNIYK